MFAPEWIGTPTELGRRSTSSRDTANPASLGCDAAISLVAVPRPHFYREFAVLDAFLYTASCVAP